MNDAPLGYLGDRLTAPYAEWHRTGNTLLQPEILRVWRAWRKAQLAVGLHAPPFLVMLP